MMLFTVVCISQELAYFNETLKFLSVQPRSIFYRFLMPHRSTLVDSPGIFSGWLTLGCRDRIIMITATPCRFITMTKT